ncbi:MAG: 30S ribosomal protein S2 [Bacteroidota bacterium]
MPAVSIEALLESGAHFGHLTRRWNPAMRNFIFMERNGIHIIDLRKTQLLIDIARDAAQEIASQGRGVLFVGTKNQAKGAVEQEAKRGISNYVSERWLGGMLTNFTTIRKSIKRLSTIDKMETDGTFEKITKKERLMLSRERDRLRKVFGGIEDMTRIPGMLVVVDIKKEHLAIKEAKTLGIPVIGIVDTNSDPTQVDYPIPANDDSIKAVELILKVLADAVVDGREVARAKTADLAAAGEAAVKDMDGDESKVRRQLRTRKGGKADGTE